MISLTFLVTVILGEYYMLIHNNTGSVEGQLYKTFITVKGKEIKYDEEYALNVAVIVYERLYNKKYSSNDFAVEDVEFKDCDNVWNVYLKETRNNIIGNGDIVYDGLTGLLISKENGGILVNFGEY